MGPLRWEQQNEFEILIKGVKQDLTGIIPKQETELMARKASPLNMREPVRSTLVGKVLDLKVESVKKILVGLMPGEQALTQMV